MINLRVDDETAIPLSVESASAVSMTVSEAFIDRGGSAIQNNKNATPSTSQVVVTPDPGFDGMAKVTVAAMPQGEIDPASLSYDTYLLRGRITAEANVTQAGYVPIGGNMVRAYCDELLPSENPKTVTPTTSVQTAVDANKWTKGQIKVGAIPPEYIIPTGTKSISANGTGIDVKAYEKVDVAVPGITPSGTLAIATNGSHDVTNYATASVAVPASAVDSGTKSITANGNGQDVVGYAAVNVNVPNSYAAADEGKVVQSGALVSQSSQTVTENGTYDTTLKNEVVVNVSGGGSDLKGIIEGTATSITDNDVTSVRANGFQNYTALQSISLPNVTTIKPNAFQQCSGLTSAYFPNLTTLNGSEQFRSCTNLQVVALPKLTSTMAYTYRYCSKLTTADLYAPAAINAMVFDSCPLFDTLILRKTSGVVSLGNVNVFGGTKFKNGGAGGTIYIPKVLYDHLGDGSNLDYKAATNWTTVNGYGTITWAKIEGSIYENAYADGTPIT